MMEQCIEMASICYGDEMCKHLLYGKKTFVLQNLKINVLMKKQQVNPDFP